MQPIEVFDRGVWKLVPSQDDVSWVHRIAASRTTSAPLGDFGSLVGDMLEKGVSAESIARFAKIIGYETAFQLCYHLEDPSASYQGFSDPEEIAWGLFRVNPDTNEPLEPMCGIHEIILGMDPSGCEIRPKNA